MTPQGTTPPVRPQGRRGQRLALLLAALGLCLATLVLGAEVILYQRTGQSWLLINAGKGGHNIYDPLLGWTSAPSTQWPNLYGPGIGAAYNARGFLATEDHSAAAPPGRFRILFLGDSFTEGVGVSAPDSYPAQMERLDPRIQSVNLAKSSYGIDQAILRYERDAADMEAALVVLAAIDNDLVRCRSDRFLGFWPKPRFVLRADGGLRLTGVPVPDFSVPPRSFPELVQRSALFLIPRRFFWELSYEQDDGALASGLLERLRGLAAERGQRLTLAYLPESREVESEEQLPLAGIMRRYADAHDVPFVDATPAVRFHSESPRQACFLDNGHYNRECHRLIAELLVKELVSPGVSSP